MNKYFKDTCAVILRKILTIFIKAYFKELSGMAASWFYKARACESYINDHKNDLTLNAERWKTILPEELVE